MLQNCSTDEKLHYSLIRYYVHMYRPAQMDITPKRQIGEILQHSLRHFGLSNYQRCDLPGSTTHICGCVGWFTLGYYHSMLPEVSLSSFVSMCALKILETSGKIILQNEQGYMDGSEL